MYPHNELFMDSTALNESSDISLRGAHHIKWFLRTIDKVTLLNEAIIRHLIYFAIHYKRVGTYKRRQSTSCFSGRIRVSVLL